MESTVTEKILARSSGNEKVKPGDVVWADVDVALTHDVLGGPAYSIFKDSFGDTDVWDSKKIVITPDHYVPNKDIDSAKLYSRVKEFVEEQEIQNFYPLEGKGNYGICHVMLPMEGHVRPGEVVVGTDSHTCTHGALGAFATGIGTTDMANVFKTGDLWFKVPETLKFTVDGRLPKNVMSKDFILKVIGDIGVKGALYRSMEFTGPGIRSMPIDERFTVSNMAIEAGAVNGIIEPDDKTLRYVKRKTDKDFDPVYSDPDAEYGDVKHYDLSSLEPQVAKPSLPENREPARNMDVEVDQAYIGSCTGGKMHDFVQAAEVLEGEETDDGVRLIVVPSTQDMYDELERRGLIKTFRNAGAVIGPPTCGACLGGHMGVLAPGEVCISSTNRNFVGRMGHPDSRVYLSSPKTVAASAIEGKITAPEV